MGASWFPSNGRQRAEVAFHDRTTANDRQSHGITRRERSQRLLDRRPRGHGLSSHGNHEIVGLQARPSGGRCGIDPLDERGRAIEKIRHQNDAQRSGIVARTRGHASLG